MPVICYETRREKRNARLKAARAARAAARPPQPARKKLTGRDRSYRAEVEAIRRAEIGAERVRASLGVRLPKGLLGALHNYMQMDAARDRSRYLDAAIKAGANLIRSEQ